MVSTEMVARDDIFPLKCFILFVVSRHKTNYI